MAASFTIETFLIRLGHLPIALAKARALVLYLFLHFVLGLLLFLVPVAAVASPTARASAIFRSLGTGCGVGHAAVSGFVG